MAINKYKKYIVLISIIWVLLVLSFVLIKINKDESFLGVALPAELTQINSLKITNPDAYKVLEKMVDVNSRTESNAASRTKGLVYTKFTDDLGLIDELQKQGYLRIIPRQEWIAVWVTQKGINEVLGLKQHEKDNAEAIRLSLIVASGT